MGSVTSFRRESDTVVWLSAPDAEWTAVSASTDSRLIFSLVNRMFWMTAESADMSKLSIAVFSHQPETRIAMSNASPITVCKTKEMPSNTTSVRFIWVVGSRLFSESDSNSDARRMDMCDTHVVSFKFKTS